MAEKTQERAPSTERRQDPEEDSPPAANPKTVERGKEISKELGETLDEIDKLLAEEAERRGHGTGEDASLVAAEEIVKTFVQRGGE